MVTTIELIHLYTKEHLTLRQIAKKVGISAPAINQRLKKAGITAKDGTYINKKCRFCANPLKVARSRARRSQNSFCNPQCKGAYNSDPNSYGWKYGSRLSRVIVSRYFKLEPGMVIRYKDGNEINNDISNLQVVSKDNKIIWERDLCQ